MKHKICFPCIDNEQRWKLPIFKKNANMPKKSHKYFPYNSCALFHVFWCNNRGFSVMKRYKFKSLFRKINCLSLALKKTSMFLNATQWSRCNGKTVHWRGILSLNKIHVFSHVKLSKWLQYTFKNLFLWFYETGQRHISYRLLYLNTKTSSVHENSSFCVLH